MSVNVFRSKIMFFSGIHIRAALHHVNNDSLDIVLSKIWRVVDDNRFNFISFASFGIKTTAEIYLGGTGKIPSSGR